MSMFRSYSQMQIAIMKACFEIELPSVEFVRVEYLPWHDRFSMILFMRPGQWHFECLFAKEDINSPDVHQVLKTVIKELKDYLNPLWC